MNIKINSWQKYQIDPRVKNPWWFKLSNQILQDEDIYSLSGDEFRAWIYILCTASRKNKGEFDINFEHAARACNVQKRAILACIEKLEKVHILETKNCNSTVDNSIPLTRLEERRGEEIREDKNIAHFTNARVYDFEKLYAAYPRKMGKKRGFSKLRTIVKSPEIFDRILVAIERYREHLSREKTETRFVKHFDTFVNSYTDWLDPDIGSVNLTKSKTGLELFTEKMQEKGHAIS